MRRNASTRAVEDPFGGAWPDALVTFLNSPYDLRAGRQKDDKSARHVRLDRIGRMVERYHSRLHAQQKRLRNLVDSLPEGEEPEKTIKLLEHDLAQAKFRTSLRLRSAQGLPAGPEGSPFIVRYEPTGKRAFQYYTSLVALARLLESGYWRSLRKCPTCGRYFLAGGYRRKKYCSKRCMWLEGQRRYRGKQTQAEQERRRELERQRYHRRHGRDYSPAEKAPA